MAAQPYVLLEPGGGESLRFLDDSELVIKAAGDKVDGALVHYEYIAKPAARGYNTTFYDAS